MDVTQAPAIKRVDEQINFQWTLFGPDPKVPYDHFAAVWEGELISAETGTFEIGIEGNDGYQLWLNNELVIDRSKDQSFHQTTIPHLFKKGEAVLLKIVYKEKSGNSWFKLAKLMVSDIHVRKTKKRSMFSFLMLQQKK